MLKKLVVFQGPYYSESGYGHHAREIIDFLTMDNSIVLKGIPVYWGSTSTSATLTPQQVSLYKHITEHNFTEGDINFIQLGLPSEFRTLGKVNIGITAGVEAENYPKSWKSYCNQMTAIVVPSSFVKNQLLNIGVTTPIYVVPQVVDTSVFNTESKDTPELNLNLSKVKDYILFVGQFLPNTLGADRKQLGTLLDVFGAVFDKNPNIGLIVKTFTSNNSTPDKVLTEIRIKDIIKRYDVDVRLMHGQLTKPELASLYRHPQIKALVLPSSGEGFGRPLLESISTGLPIITTNFSGPLDFIDPKYDTLLPYNLGAIPVEIYRKDLFEPGMYWAYPHVDNLATALVAAIRLQKENKIRALEGMSRAKKYSKAGVGSQFSEILDTHLVNAVSKLEVFKDVKKF